jgi:hypothetical protein
VMSLVCATALNLVVGTFQLKVMYEEVHELVPPWLLGAGAVVLMAFLVWSLSRWVWRKLPWSGAPAKCCSSGACEANAHSAAAAAEACGAGGHCDCESEHEHEHEAAHAESCGCGCDCGGDSHDHEHEPHA